MHPFFSAPCQGSLHSGGSFLQPAKPQMFCPSPLHTHCHPSPTPWRSKVPPTSQAPSDLKPSALSHPYIPQCSPSLAIQCSLTALVNPPLQCQLQCHTREAFPSTALEPAQCCSPPSRPLFLPYHTFQWLPSQQVCTTRDGNLVSCSAISSSPRTASSSPQYLIRICGIKLRI